MLSVHDGCIPSVLIYQQKNIFGGALEGRYYLLFGFRFGHCGNALEWKFEAKVSFARSLSVEW